MARGFLRNCFVDSRGEPLFTQHSDGDVIATLDGYAVIPIEDYHTLNNAKGWPPDSSFPCAACGAAEPTPEGHDPCIANLPGVAHACCGHGQGHAYVMFNDGTVMRGVFENRRSNGEAGNAR